MWSFRWFAAGAVLTYFVLGSAWEQTASTDEYVWECGSFLRREELPHDSPPSQSPWYVCNTKLDDLQFRTTVVFSPLGGVAALYARRYNNDQRALRRKSL